MTNHSKDDGPEPVDPRLVQTWERLLKLARGSADVVEVLLPVAAGLTRDEVVKLLNWQKDTSLEALEQTWKLLGVVPRYRYEELMRRYDTLRRRVDEAEKSLHEVERMLRREERDAEAKDALDSWGSLVRRTLSPAAGIVRSVAGSLETPALPEPPLEPEPEAPKRTRAATPRKRSTSTRSTATRTRKRPTP